MNESADPARDHQPESESPASSQPTDLVPGSALRRLIAFLVDLVPVGAFHLAAGRGSWLLTAIFFALYHTVSLTLWGRTLGKAAVALRVQTPDGSRLRWLPALLRSTIGYLASTFFFLGFLHIFRDARRRSWHDVLFGSEVVQQTGALSVTQVIRAIDEWTGQLDALVKRVLDRYDRIKRLWSFALKLTGVLTVLQTRVEQAYDFVARALGYTKASPAASATQEAPGAATGATTGTGAMGTAASTVTAVVLGGASVVIYLVSAPPGLNLWDAGLPSSTALSGECSGTITPSVARGYVGDFVDNTITITPPFDKIITHVTTNNPACMGCDAKQTGPGRFTLRLRFTGTPGPARVEFVAHDKDGKVRCRGHTTELTILGPRQP